MNALCEFLEYQVRWHMPNKDGNTDYELLSSTVQIPDDPELEQGSDHILRWFWQLNARRQPGFSGLSPLTFQDIAAWQSLTGQITRPEEIDALLQMDSAYLQAIQKKRDEDE